ncbi:ABC transporter ATP-binding protein [Patescibacteria group bacterium]|nr:MAG: ABC transporter ATP-binding protein [Patescibacteria group bacterium]
MNNPIIEIHNLSKSYIISHRLPYATFRDTAAELIKKPFRLLSTRNEVVKKEDFWALRDINLSINQGEKIGIVGRNGAGKSTLLKILSQITPPTSGKVHLRGRVASLLEVGTGFHPELTGRENVFLNGAILGMKQKEIMQKFDEIVDFAEIEKFLDTPVKRYSSGMYVRLAFAVAAHLEPEILIVDEVLAVGDAQFQKKCLGKMEEVGKLGRTIIFVSHNMGIVNQLCTKSILLESGCLIEYAETSHVIKRYLTARDQNASKVVFDKKTIRRGDGRCTFDWVEIRNEENIPQTKFSIGDNLMIVFQFSKNKPIPWNIRMGVQCFSPEGIAIANMVDIDSRFNINQFKDHNEVTVKLHDIRFYPGTYSFSIALDSENSESTYDYIENAIAFEVINGGKLATRDLPRSTGLLLLTPEWGSRKNDKT